MYISSVFAGLKHILTQIHHGAILMTRMLGEYIQPTCLAFSPSSIRSFNTNNQPSGNHWGKISASEITSCNLTPCFFLCLRIRLAKLCNNESVGVDFRTRLFSNMQFGCEHTEGPTTIRLDRVWNGKALHPSMVSNDQMWMGIWFLIPHGKEDRPCQESNLESPDP